MTDEQQPNPAPQPDPALPVAGRKPDDVPSVTPPAPPSAAPPPAPPSAAPPPAPPSAAPPPAPPSAPSSSVTAEATAEATEAPPGKVVGEGPTVPLKRAPEEDDGGKTQRLVPPAPAAEQPPPPPEEAPEPEPDDGATRRLVPPGPAPAEEEPAASPEPVKTQDAAAEPEPATAAPWRRLSSAGALIWVLLALFGFTLVVQLRSNDTDDGLATARQEDLVRILSDLEAQDTRLQAEITALESSRQRLTSGVAGREAALAEADKRAEELGLLAGTLPGRGPGLRIVLDGVKASAVLNAVQELRGAGGEVMELAGTSGGSVRIVASTYFVDAEGGGIVADGARLTGPYTLWVIGQPQTMETALQIPGGVVASVKSDGGSVTMQQRESVDVTTTRKATSLRYARPVS
jgi:uncharacterized protein YlxW (UPF0749 family)